MATTSANPKNFKSAASLVDKQFHIVYISAKGVVTIAADATTGKVMGVIQNAPQAGVGQNVAVALPFGERTFKVISGGSISIGDKLTSDASGHAIATTSAGNYVFGVAIEPADANDVFEYMPHFEKHA